MQTSALLLWSVVLNILSYLAFLFNKKLSKAKAFSGILTKASHDQIKRFTTNLEIREVSELSGNLNMDSFLVKNQGIIREFWLNIREIKKN